MRTAAVIGTFDTKGKEFAYLTACLEAFGVETVTVDVGTGPSLELDADYRMSELIGEEILKAGPKEKRMKCLAAKADRVIGKLVSEGAIQGVISMGGGQGTFLAREIFSHIPIGFPKILVSTLAHMKDSAAQFGGLNDTLVMNSLVDIAGLNGVLRNVLRQAAGALAGMLANQSEAPEEVAKPAVGISCWGVTTPCVNEVRSVLEEHGYEVYAFHANGEGGAMLERFVKQGLLCGVADITLSEITMPMAGSYQETVPERLETEGPEPIPRVVVPGGLDMVLRGREELKTLPGRKTYYHTPEVVFVRSTPQENALFAAEICRRLGQLTGPVTLMLPQNGVSMADSPEGPLYEPETDQVLFGGLRDNLPEGIRLIEMPCNINDKDFADKIAEELIDKMEMEEKKDDSESKTCCS